METFATLAQSSHLSVVSLCFPCPDILGVDFPPVRDSGLMTVGRMMCDDLCTQWARP
jgi:hypothetical protein